jgi:uncharacterized protein with FMN-binding domain
MLRKMGRYVLFAISALMLSTLLTGCIPPNEHVGKPAPHSYKDGYYDGYYGGGYYHHPYNGDYYYR